MRPNKKIAFFQILSCLGVVLVMLFRPERLNSEFETKYYWTYKAHTTDKFDFVFYGDSRVYRGISPKIVLEGTDFTGYNFGFSSGSMSKDMLEFAESRVNMKGTQPSIVLGITPHSLTQESIQDKHYRQELFRPPYDVFQRYYIDRYLKIFDRITPEELIGNLDWVTHEWCSDDGWMMCDNKVAKDQASLDHYEKILTDNPIDSVTVENLFQKVEEWTKKGIKVYAYRPPTLLLMEELEERKTGFDEAMFIERFEKAGGQWLYVDKDAFDTYDGSHLRESEVIRFSKEINRLMGIH